MLLFDELRRLIVNSGNPGQAGPFDELGRLLVSDSHKSTGTGGALPAATTTAAGAVRAATAAESVQATGKINLAWSINKLRALFATALQDDVRITTLATITRIADLPPRNFMVINLDRPPAAGTVVMLTIVSPMNRVHPFMFPADDFLTEIDDTAGDPPTSTLDAAARQIDTENMIQLKTTRNALESNSFSHSIWFVAKASDMVMWIASEHSTSWGIFKAIVREQR